MQNELYVENDVLNLKEFLSLQDEKEVLKIIYWNWAKETGDTEEEIHENDLIDSEFMGKKLQMAISVTGRQDVATSSDYYMVTLDANGGKIESSASVQKQVTGGEAYGKLPTPTRIGYEFIGWETVDNQISTNKSDWEIGAINIKGVLENSDRRLRLKNYLKVSPNTKYRVNTNEVESINIRLIEIIQQKLKMQYQEEIGPRRNL